MKKSAWDVLSKRGHDETLANRDVFESQQLVRSSIDPVQTKTSRTILAAVVGILSVILAWFVFSFGQYATNGISEQFDTSAEYTVEYYDRVAVNTVISKYCLLDGPEGNLTDVCFDDEATAQASPPTWYIDGKAQHEAAVQAEKDANPIPDSIGGWILVFKMWKLLLSLLIGLIVFGLLYTVLMMNLRSQNALNDTSDINQHKGDQHIALPDEIIRKFDWFPDVGATSPVLVSSMISHVMLSNSGLDEIQIAKRYESDVEIDDEYFFKGEIVLDENDQPVMETVPLIDEDFGDSLFDASNLPKDKKLRKKYDATKISYNPDGSNRDKVGKYNTVADMINDTWRMPVYEPQRPAGAYIVDTAPVNTMVLAITRAGKGQTYIEPVIDMWLREQSPNNMVINDPKGELLVKHYVRATMRGFQVVQFNLINAIKTDIYNPLGMAAESAREGDSTKCALYVENIAEVFFPLDGGEDPVWPNAANNAFKRAAYGLIDFYLEEERELRAYAARVNMAPKVLENKLDAMWGKVTLYNCYQLFVQLTAKKLKNPIKEVERKLKAGDYGSPDDADNFDYQQYDYDTAEADKQAFMWDDASEADMLTLFFNATEHLPKNSMRELVNNANNALKSMGAAEKMLASVYGIAVTAMSFFADPTISTLTSGTPSQNVDLGGLSFPRRMGIRFSANYVKRNHLLGSQAVWQAYTDDTFTESLGKDFYHEDTISREGWARYYFKGIFPEMTSYLKLQVRNPQTGMLIREFFFKFTKTYQTSLNGRYYIADPVTEQKVIRNGVLTELCKTKSGKHVPGHVQYPEMKLINVSDPKPQKVKTKVNAIIQWSARYSEQPKAVFLVTPPHLMKYAKLILILLKQLVDLNFDKSYMTKSNQKPLYKTRYMLDEAGNLQSEGHGLSGFETMLSIGLGQEQQFTIILQTLQQLRAVYGDDIDKIVQGNAQPLNALIATPSGWITMGDAQVGTEVLVPAGGSAFVTGVYPRGVRPVYNVIRADGSSAEACNEHLWEIEIESEEE